MAWVQLPSYRKPLYNRPMLFGGDSRRRSVVLLGAGVLLFFALLGALQAFNTSNVRFLNPETAGETLAFTGLTVVVFLLLLVLLMLLLRNILKLYADQSSSALGARLRTRMVLGAALIALTPAVFMFLFSFQLDEPLHRSLVLTEHVGTARGLDAGGAGTGAIRHQQRAGGGGIDCRIGRAGPGFARPAGCVESRTASRSLADLPWSTARTCSVLASFQAPRGVSAASLLPWLERGRAGGGHSAARAALGASACDGAAQR